MDGPDGPPSSASITMSVSSSVDDVGAGAMLGGGVGVVGSAPAAPADRIENPARTATATNDFNRIDTR